MDVAINYLAVIVATVVAVAIGVAWYGPLFGKQWMRLMGFSKEDMKDMKMSPTKAMTISSLATLVMVFVLAQFVAMADVQTVAGSLHIALLIWIGFVATTLLNGVLFERRSLKHFYITAGHQFVAIAAAAVILTLWP